MRTSTTIFGLPLATLLFGLMLIPRAALADSYANCPTEPALNVPIAMGQTFEGATCMLGNPGDVDSFVFNNGTVGAFDRITVAINGAASANICLTIYGPNLSLPPIFAQCSNVPFTPPSVSAGLKLKDIGRHTIVVTEASLAPVKFGLTLARLYPFLDATRVQRIPQSFTGNITPLTDSDSYIFPSVATGRYRVTDYDQHQLQPVYAGVFLQLRIFAGAVY